MWYYITVLQSALTGENWFQCIWYLSALYLSHCMRIISIKISTKKVSSISELSANKTTFIYNYLSHFKYIYVILMNGHVNQL